MREGLRHRLLRDLGDEHVPELGAVGDDADVGAVALVAGAAVGELAQRYGAGGHQLTHSILGVTASRGTKQDAVESRGRIPVRTPPPPAGPQV